MTALRPRSRAAARAERTPTWTTRSQLENGPYVSANSRLRFRFAVCGDCCRRGPGADGRTVRCRETPRIGVLRRSTTVRSGGRDSNPRHPAWKEPLSTTRPNSRSNRFATPPFRPRRPCRLVVALSVNLRPIRLQLYADSASHITSAGTYAVKPPPPPLHRAHQGLAPRRRSIRSRPQLWAASAGLNWRPAAGQEWPNRLQTPRQQRFRQMSRARSGRRQHLADAACPARACVSTPAVTIAR